MKPLQPNVIRPLIKTLILILLAVLAFSTAITFFLLNGTDISVAVSPLEKLIPLTTSEPATPTTISSISLFKTIMLGFGVLLMGFLLLVVTTAIYRITRKEYS